MLKGLYIISTQAFFCSYAATPLQLLHCVPKRRGCVLRTPNNTHNPFPFPNTEWLTHVPDVLSHQFAFGQGCHSDAVVPVSTTEEQLGIMGHCKQLGGDLQPWGKRTTHVSLCSVGKRWAVSSNLSSNPCILHFLCLEKSITKSIYRRGYNHGKTLTATVLLDWKQDFILDLFSLLHNWITHVPTKHCNTKDKKE